MQWKLDSDGDLDLTGGVFNTVTGAEETSQRVKIRLRWGAGESFVNRLAGIPYVRSLIEAVASLGGDLALARIIGKNPNLNHARTIFRRAIQTTPGVDTVNFVDVTLEKVTRRMLVDWAATTTDGDELNVGGFSIL